MEEKSTMDLLLEKFMSQQPVSQQEFTLGRVTISLMSNNAFFYGLDGRQVNWIHSRASVADGRMIDTRTAVRTGVTSETEEGKLHLHVEYEGNGLRLTQHMTLEEDKPYFIGSCQVKDLQNEQTESNYLAPLDFAYPNAQCNPLFLSLDQKMLLVPYDNDMWVRYESTPLRPGRTSYEVTAIYNELTNEGMVVGALDFDNWKNAIRCSAWDARCYTAFSGVADECTHDLYPHGTLIGESVSSARFMCGWYDDIRTGMEVFGKLAMEGKPRFHWSGPVPFGWNSFSAINMAMPLLEHWEGTSKFFSEELPNFCDSNGSTFINMDANFLLDPVRMQEVMANIRSRGQQPGSYMVPGIAITMLADLMPLRGAPGKTMKDILLKDHKGDPYPTIDGSLPVDITIPEAEQNMRLWIRELVEQGFAYIKIDFLAHSAVEAVRYDKRIRTGRQAMNRFYQILWEELDPEKIGREVFVDLSIAPLFPGGGGHGRRCCCDSFGQHEDVRYVLNALNFGWWTNGSLYQFADPDHTVLSHSFVDGRGDTDYYSAKSRFNASVISGTVMLLSDNYGPTGDEDRIARTRERTRELANNPKLNEIARFGKAFVPAYLRSDTTNVYFLHHQGRSFVALFNFDSERRTVSVPAAVVKARQAGEAENLNNGQRFAYDGEISVTLEGFDSAVLELF